MTEKKRHEKTQPKSMRYFNTEGLCEPDRHYMVRLDERLAQIKERYVDRGSYFVMNRGRQYGKTTTLKALAEYLKEDYAAVFLDFQRMSSAAFQDENRFASAFTKYFSEQLKEKAEGKNLPELQKLTKAAESGKFDMNEMFFHISSLCGKSEKPLVLLIDEVDSASNNQVFLDFLAMLRGYYLDRKNCPAFHSVILAGVYDIKNLKLKIRPEEEHKYNSPWNIAAKFNIQMSFLASQIASMLREYEADHHTGMDIDAVADCIYEYTSGYPYLVSAICKLLDEEIPYMGSFRTRKDVWGREGIEEAVKIILKTDMPLFGSMTRALDDYKDLRKVLEDIIYRGVRISYSPDVRSVNLGMMFGFLKEDQGSIAIANRIFEMRLLNMFITEEAVGSEAFRCGERDRNQFIKGGRLDMKLVLEKFVQYFQEIYGENDEKFIEAQGRKFFLLYLKPIINGVGNYYMEAQTRDARRTDVIVDYRGEQFIVELKIWHGNEYNERGEAQLAEYLDYYRQEKGYLVSFNFNKGKKPGVQEINVGGRTIVEAVV